MLKIIKNYINKKNKKHEKKLFFKNFINEMQEFNKHDVVFYPPQGLGDILLLCMYVKEYKKINNVKVAVIVTKKHFFSLVSLFTECIDKIFEIESNDVWYFKKCLKKNNYKNVYYNIDNYMYSKNALPAKNMKDAMLNAINLPYDSSFFIPMMSCEKGIQKREKTIVISPDSVSCEELISKDYWLNLAKELEEKGFIVVFNTNNSAVYPGYSSIFLPIDEMINYVKGCYCFIGYRSGLCDLVAAFTNIKQIVFYPNKKDYEKHILNNDNKPYAEAYMRYASLKDMYCNENIFEYIFNDNIDILKVINGIEKK